MAEHTFKKQRSLLLDGVIVFLKIFGEIFLAIIKIFVKDPPKDISGEIVLITGSAHGIGRELVLQYVALGCEVVCVDINEEENRKVVIEANKLRMGNAYSYRCDITKREDLLVLADRILHDVGYVSVIVNNAGIMRCYPLLKHTEAQIRSLFDVNVLSHFWIFEAFMPHLLAKGRGHIVAISSVSGIVGLSNLVPYSASKFAVRGLMEALSEEIREKNNATIETTVVYPFLVATGLWKKPKIRFPSLLGALTPKKAAEHIIDAHRRNKKEVAIPNFLFSMNNIFRCLPPRCADILRDFIDSGLESEL